MVEPIAHYFIPTLILFSLFPERRKTVLLLSPLALLPDFDFFIGHLYLFHNLLFVFVVSGLVGFYYKERLPSFLAFYFLFAHLLLDTFGPGVGFFYPLYPRLFRFDFFLYTSPAEGELSMEGNVMTQVLEAATRDQLAPAVTSFGVILLVLICGAVLLRNRIGKD
jgi:membrane-bound metal-dependent hydrolase YbcI (DUF457 family)